MIYGTLLREGAPVFQEVMCTRFFWERMQGLLFRKPLTERQALLIKPCNSIHCIGMTYSLDVVFLNADFEILKVVESIKPFGFAGSINASMALEMRQGLSKQKNLQKGDQLEWQTA